MPDYAGAVGAIEARLTTAWTETPLGLANGKLTKKDGPGGKPAPWVYAEVVGAGSTLVGVGRPGDKVSVHDGLIEMHVFVPKGSGSGLAHQHAVALGEVFRDSEFYRDVPGFCVRCFTPRISGADSGSDDGLWFRVTCTVPFEFWSRG